MFYCKFFAESKDEKILKIGEQMPKLLTNNIVGVFSWLTVYMVQNNKAESTVHHTW